jgi:dCMP deaminase
MKNLNFFKFLNKETKYKSKKQNNNSIIPDNIEKFDYELMETAKILAKKSYCKKRQVGAVISEMLPPNTGQTIAHGYNGTLPGEENVCEDEIYYCTNCKTEAKKEEELFENNVCKVCKFKNTKAKKLKTKDFTYHAEQNAIAAAARRGISTMNTQIHITCSPCKECAKLIANVGIKRVVYLDDYKDKEGIEYLKAHGVEVIKYNS